MPSITRKMNVICRCFNLYRAQQLPNDELTPTHHSFILCICNHPGMSQDQIASHLCFNKSTVARCLSQLEKNGYVTRTPSETDKRMTTVFPTEKMLAVLPDVKRITREWNAGLGQDMTDGEAALFFDLLDRMAARAKALSSEAEGEEQT